MEGWGGLGADFTGNASILQHPTRQACLELFLYNDDTMDQVSVILQMQAILERTPTGRPISDQVVSILRRVTVAPSQPNQPNQPNQSQQQYLRCRGCGLVLHQDRFAAGCPNCNIKDVDRI